MRFTKPGFLVLTLLACGGSSHDGFGDPDSGENGDAPFSTNDAGFKPGSDGGSDNDGGGPALIYAHTDSELYTLDPDSHAVTDIGPFSLGSSTPTITDLAVDAKGNVWVNSETAIYTAAVPTSPGPVPLTLVANIATKSQYFYALGFAPANVLDATETLVAGDSNGALWAVATNGTTTEPRNVRLDLRAFRRHRFLYAERRRARHRDDSIVSEGHVHDDQRSPR